MVESSIGESQKRLATLRFMWRPVVGSRSDRVRGSRAYGNAFRAARGFYNSC